MTGRKLQVYLRLGGVSFVILMLLIFVFSNTQPISIRFLWWKTPEIPLFWFTVIAANFGIIISWIFRRMCKIIHDIRLVRQDEKTRQQLINEVRRETDHKKTQDNPNNSENL